MPDQTRERESASKPEADPRLDKLGAALEQARGKSPQGQRKETSSSAGYGQAMRLSSEFIAGILVGAGVGWGIDYLAGTSPWGLIVFLMLGFAAGVLNVMRAANLIEDQASRLEDDPAKRD